MDGNERFTVFDFEPVRLDDGDAAATDSHLLNASVKAREMTLNSDKSQPITLMTQRTNASSG